MFKKQRAELSMVANAYNAALWEVEAEGLQNLRPVWAT